MPDSDERQIKLRYAGTCRVCQAGLPAGHEAIYERTTKTVRCPTCSTTPTVDLEPADRGTGRTDADDDIVRPELLDIGTPGASARREFERRQAKREARIREKHPKLGRLILAMSDDPHSTTAWRTGAIGEEHLGKRLNDLSSERMRVLHDRRIPGTKANIDHLAVTPTGIYVIDAKRYKGRPTLKVEGGILRARTEKLLVGSRDCTKLVDGVVKQVDVVRSLLGSAMPITGVLCFVEANWPLIGGAFTARDVEVLWPKKLYPRLRAEGAYDQAVAAAHERLASSLPPA